MAERPAPDRRRPSGRGGRLVRGRGYRGSESGRRGIAPRGAALVRWWRRRRQGGAQARSLRAAAPTWRSAWEPPRLWRAAQLAARGLLGLLARVEVTGELPAQLHTGRSVTGPLILAANHISPFDPIVLTAVCRTRRVAPRFLATGGLFRAPVIGPVMRHWGHIPVHRGTRTATRALAEAAEALAAGSVVLLYPEGRIGLEPGMWPERGKTGVARLALVTGAPVVPVAQWGAHEVVPYATPRGLLRALPRTIWRRPVIRVRFGQPVQLADLRDHAPGHARRATDRIIAAITRDLAPLRADEPDRPRHHDPTRPIRTPPEDSVGGQPLPQER